LPTIRPNGVHCHPLQADFRRKWAVKALFFTHVLTHALTFNPRLNPAVKTLQGLGGFHTFAAENLIFNW
jgi:hypothetical protein